MSWNRVSTRANITVDADVDLDEFSDKQVLQELINREIITPAEASGLQNRAMKKKADGAALKLSGAQLDRDDIDRALELAQRHRHADALYYLERGLGRQWAGLLAH